MATAIVLILIVVGSVLFHIYNPWVLTPLASHWETMDDTGLARGPKLTGAHSTTRDFASADSLPVLLDLPGSLIGAGFNHHQNTAILDACFVEADALFRNAPIAERANEPGYEARHDKAKGGLLGLRSGKLRATHRTAAAVSGLAGPR